jgi:hypothetical protein
MRRLVQVAIAVFALSSPVLAQTQVKGALEFGVDANLSVGLDDPNVTTLNLPVQRLRVGYFISPRISIEPYGNLNWTHVEGADAVNLNFGVGGLYHFSDHGTPRWYARPFAEFQYNHIDADNGGSESATTGAIGAGVGAKFPFKQRFAWRTELAFTQTFAHGGVDAQSTLSLFAGLSFFLP